MKANGVRVHQLLAPVETIEQLQFENTLNQEFPNNISSFLPSQQEQMKARWT